MLVLMAGLPGSGKSTLGRVLSERLPAVLLDKDDIRAALFPPDAIEYSSEQDDVCMDALLLAARFLLAKGRVVIIDGRPFTRRCQLDAPVQAARQVGVPLKVIECACPLDVIRARLEQDPGHVARNRNFALVERLAGNAEPLILPHLTVDTTRLFDACLSACLEYLKA